MHSLLGLLFPFFKWSAERDNGQGFTPCEADRAMQLVDDKFDAHVSMQWEVFWQPDGHHKARDMGNSAQSSIAMFCLFTYCMPCAGRAKCGRNP